MATLSPDKTYVTVVKGDTLSEIARDYKAYSGGASYQQLAAINGIPNPNLIYVGQKIKLVKDSQPSPSPTPTPSPTPSPGKPSVSNVGQATITHFGHQSDSDSTLFAMWSWGQSNTEHYETEWSYETGGLWFTGNKSTTDEKQSTYSIPSNAKQVRFRVKPVSKTHKVDDKDTAYWTASWSSYKTYDVDDLPPKVPSTPTVDIDKYKLTAEIDNIDADDLNATGVQFQVIKNDTTVFATGNVAINTTLNRVSYSCTVSAGSEYKVRCRSYRGSTYSDWSNYSSDVKTIPSTPSKITSCKASSETSVYLAWSSVVSATSYDIEYATKKDNFDRTSDTTTKSGVTLTYFEITGLESGQEYFFRVRAVNDKGSSGWSGISSVIIGKKPSAPTTWSSTTTVVTGEDLTLYWVHNSEDNSSQTFAQLELYINGKKQVYTIENTKDEDLKDQTSSYVVNTRPYVEGTEIKWRVRTAGILATSYGEWSIERVVNVYAPPTLELSVTDLTGSPFETLQSFPIQIDAVAGPNTQTPTGYSLTVTSKEFYETIDQIGNKKTINAGDNVYSKYFDVSTPLSVALSAGDIDLENNVSYTITCIVSMNSGLTATVKMDFRVAWTDIQHAPNAEINIDSNALVAHIRPYCVDVFIHYYIVKRAGTVFNVTDEEIIDGVYGTELSNTFTSTGEQVWFGTTADGDSVYYCEKLISVPVENVSLSVYRREFDGKFTMIAQDIDNMSNTFVTDPHPALDYARYRIVAVTHDTGAVSYYDAPGYPTGESAVIIQWDEEWTSFDVTSEDAMEQPAWSGSLLKLPYNIDISDSSDQDVELIKYIGREHPVSYYGTQVGHTSTWNVDIEANDKETLYALRRLQNWMGDVYVREPSGSGYWANIKVSLSKAHRDLTIPVSMNVTRVEGGM